MMSILKLSATLPPVSTGKDFFEAHPGLWSFGAVVVAALSLVISGLGLYFIWVQLKAGREAVVAAALSAQAAAEATRIAHSATRPWIKLNVSKAYLYFNEQNPEEVGCQVNYKLKNVGNTPAVDLRLIFKPIPMGYRVNTDVAAELNGLRDLPRRNPRVLFPGDEIDEGLSTNFPFPRQEDESMIGFKIVVAAFYRAAFDGQEYWTPAVLGLQHEVPPVDRVYRFYRGMGNVPCLVLPLRDETPQPT